MTFLAFGNGAPDIFSAIAAVGNAKGGDVGLAFGALFGNLRKKKIFKLIWKLLFFFLSWN